MYVYKFLPEIKVFISVATRCERLLISCCSCHQVQFSISQLAASGLKVNRLDMYGEVSVIQSTFMLTMH